MEAAHLVREYPVLYHMAEDGSWPSIQEHGLLSTSVLLDLCGIDGANRRAIEGERRARSVSLEHPTNGIAMIRDQLPLREAFLATLLDDGMTPADWYRLLNSFVFFWLSEPRLNRLLRARAYRDRPHVVLEVDTQAIVERHGNEMRLAPINTGSTLFNAPRRGRSTFATVEEYPYEEWRRRRGRLDAIVELAVPYAVPDIAAATIRATRRQGDQLLAVLG